MFLGLAMAANAQFILGGQCGFQTNGNSYNDEVLDYSAPVAKASQLVIAPTLGYQMDSKWQFGASILYELASNTAYNSVGYLVDDYEGWGKNRQSSFGIAPYARYNVTTSGKWTLFAQCQLGLMWTPKSYTHTYSTTPSIDNETYGTTKDFNLELSIVPGLNYRISDKCSADLYIDLAGLLYNHNVTTNYNDLTDEDKVTSTDVSNYFGLVANAAAQDLNAHLGNFRLGFNYHF